MTRLQAIIENISWALFHHPGDMNDAWKTGGSGIRPELAAAAHRTGVDAIWYSYRNYLELTKKHRDKQ